MFVIFGGMPPNSTPLDDRVRQFLGDLARLFTPRVLCEIARTGESGYMQAVLAESGLDEVLPPRSTLAEVFETVYKLLSDFYRCEYVFKNSVACQLVLDRHTPADSSMFFEMRVGGKVADVVVFNGTSTVYEIKTGLDTLSRLPEQLDVFSRSFDRVYVVTEASRVDEVLAHLPETVGLVSLSADGVLQECMESESHTHQFSPEIAFDVLRLPEYIEVTKRRHGRVPEVASWELYDACRAKYCSLDAHTAHEEFCHVMGQRRITEPKGNALTTAPESLKAAVIHARMCKRDWNALPERLDYVM